ncbi:MAG: hypothetical protein QNJ60_17540 [Xenococcaceae cyanobacterium MO_188.B19]|nr:hypothetical protein [Xenococcaceae cyanobacterium MO_188.B19]
MLPSSGLNPKGHKRETQQGSPYDHGDRSLIVENSIASKADTCMIFDQQGYRLKTSSRKVYRKFFDLLKVT